MSRKKTTYSSGYEKGIDFFSKRIRPVLSEDETVTLEAAAINVLIDYERCLKVQYSGHDSNGVFKNLQHSIESFLTDLSGCNDRIEKMKIFSLLLEAMEKCQDFTAKLRKDTLTAQERELRRLANTRPLVPLPEKTDRKLDKYRTRPKYV